MNIVALLNILEDVDIIWGIVLIILILLAPVKRLSTNTYRILYLVYSVLMGIILIPILLIGITTPSKLVTISMKLQPKLLILVLLLLPLYIFYGALFYEDIEEND